MRSFTLAIIVAIAISIFGSPCHAQNGKAVQTIVKVLTGIGAAEAVRRSGQSFEQYKQEDAILTSLRNQGVDAKKSSVFSVYFRTIGGRWADFWTNPDLFFVVDIEGQGSKLVPQIHYNYRGEPVLDVIVSETVPPGSRIVVRVIDDDTSSDLIWNNILKTRVTLSVTPEVKATQFVSIRASASGQIALLDRSATLDAPDFIASAEFIVPKTDDGLWVADAKLIDGSQKDVGSLQFSSLWSAPQKLAEQKTKVASSFGNFLFWGVIGLCLLVWFGSSFVSQRESPPIPKEGI